MSYALHLLIYLAIYAIAAMGLNLVVGYCGRLTLAHAAYFAIGAYVYALTSLRLDWDFTYSALCAVIVAAILSLAVSLPAWSFNSDLFVLVSLAVQVLLYSLLYNWTSPGLEIGTLANLTNGSYGIAGIPRPYLFGFRMDTMGMLAALAVGTAALAAVVVWLLVRSPWGRLLQCMRDDELAARGLGKNLHLVKIQAFAFASGLAALAGVLYAAYVGYIDPSSANLDHSILMLAMVLVGGAGSFTGPLIGAVVLLAIPEMLRYAQLPEAVVASVRMAVYGAFLVVLMHVRPQGLAGEYRLR
jgi:branched-chain amino acid transport system permease protein